MNPLIIYMGFFIFMAVCLVGVVIMLWVGMMRADKEYRDFLEEQRQIEKALGLDRDNLTELMRRDNVPHL